jgi:hypothetical protein
MCVPIHHVYGSLGKLPRFQGKRHTGYGAPSSPSNIAVISEGIRTYTESVADEEETEAITEAVEESAKLVFLGCGFHEPNMALLRASKRRTAPEVIATIYGASPTDQGTIQRRVRGLFAKTVHDLNLHSMTATAIFDEYSLALTD